MDYLCPFQSKWNLTLWNIETIFSDMGRIHLYRVKVCSKFSMLLDFDGHSEGYISEEL